MEIRYKDSLKNIWNEIEKSERISLNLGCGTKLLAGFVNIDLYVPISIPSDDGFFIQSDIAPLSWIPDHSVDYIRAEFVMEHLHQAEAMEALYHWWRVLKHGGQLEITVPDVQTIAGSIMEDPSDLVMLSSAAGCLLAAFLGKGGADGATPHKSLWTGAALKRALKIEGYNTIIIRSVGTKEWGLMVNAVAGMKEGEEE